jgi:hypothetical protein
MQPDKRQESFGQKLSIMNVNTLEKEKVKGYTEIMESENKDEILPQLSIHTLKKVFVKILVQKLIKDGKFHN